MTTHIEPMNQEAIRVLRGAQRLRVRAGRSPRDLRRRLRGPVLVLVAGIVLALGAAIFLALGSATSPESRWLGAFVFLGGVLVSTAAIAGCGVILWGAYVQQYVDALEARGDAAETLHQVVGLVRELQRTEVRQEIERRTLEATRGSHLKIGEGVCREVVEVTTEIASHRVERYLARLEGGLDPT